MLGRKLNHIAGELQNGSERLRAAARQVAASSQSLAEGAGGQAAALEQTSAALEEFSSMTRRNAQNAANAKEFTIQTRKEVERGSQRTCEMERATRGIQSASGEMREAMQGIKAASADVSKIIKTIDEIAFQTNILALNAAVEAARAGEAGMGFAVVADEVRNLARRSAKAARETTDLIEASIRRSDDAVQVTEKVSSAVEALSKESRQIEAQLREIFDKASQVDEQVGQIALASREQSQGIAQVTTALNQMDAMTQRTAANAQENSSAADVLKGGAEELNNIVGELLHLTSFGAGAVPELDSTPESPAQPREVFAPGPSPVEASSPAENDELIKWDPARMSTGEPSVDSQHQELIAMINRLHKACLAGTGKEELREMMGFLGDYVHRHFAHEEGLMEHKLCPSREKNKIAHEKFLEKFQSLVTTFDTQGPTTSVLLELRNLVGGWLTNHICSIDTKLRGCNSSCASQHQTIQT